MNKEKVKKSLGRLKYSDLVQLKEMVENELAENRIQYSSNLTHTPNEQCKGLQSLFGQAWIH